MMPHQINPQWQYFYKHSESRSAVFTSLFNAVRGLLQATILQWEASPFSGGCPNPGIETRSLTLQADS